jgi:hypothetical protein
VKKNLEKLAKIDRRIIFLLVMAVMIVPLMLPLGLAKVETTDAVKGVYDSIESLPPGSPILISYDFDPSSKPELQPQVEAVLRHAFRKNLRVVALNLWQTGIGIAESTLSNTAKEYKKEYGKDYVYLGFQFGYVAVITGMGTDIYKMFPMDARMKKDLRAFPAMKDIKSLKDFSFMITFTAGTPGIDEWLAYGADKFKFKIGAGCTAVNETALRPYLQSGQVVGVIGAMKGAAEYENLINKPGLGTSGMDAISMGHLLILALICLSNIIMVVLKIGA